jgi:hypothetical protein
MAFPVACKRIWNVGFPIIVMKRTESEILVIDRRFVSYGGSYRGDTGEKGSPLLVLGQEVLRSPRRGFGQSSG